MFLGRTILLTLILGLAVHGQAHAQKKALDDIVEALCRNQKKLINNADELADFRFRSQRTFDELLPSPGGPRTIPDADIMRRLGVLTDDSSVKSAVGNLDHPWQRRLAVELGETASDIVRRNSDDGVLILRNMDKEGLTFCRIYPARGRLLDEVYRDSAQATTLLQKTGKVGLDFYEKYVRPHKGKWVAAGLLATFYSNPEYFIDSAGDLTEYAIKKFGELGIAATAGAGKGMADTAEKAFQTFFKDLFFHSIWGALIFVVAGIVAINWLGGQFGLRPGWLFRWPAFLIFSAIRRRAPESLRAPQEDADVEAMERGGQDVKVEEKQKPEKQIVDKAEADDKDDAGENNQEEDEAVTQSQQSDDVDDDDKDQEVEDK